jgi:TraB/PrgY/gumN family
MKLFKLIIQWFFVWIFLAAGTAPVAAQTDTFASVWAWEVTSAHRKIYVMGEMNSFISGKTKTVNHDLGLAIYGASTQVWTEAPAKWVRPHLPIDELVSPDIWSAYQDALRTNMLSISQGANSESVAAYKSTVDKVKITPAFFATLYLTTTGAMRKILSNLDLSIQASLTQALTKSEVSQKNKQKTLEKATAVEDAWHQYCATPVHYDDLLNAAIQDSNSGYVFSAIPHTIFMDKSADLEELSSSLLALSDGPLMAQCIINPRSKAWLPLLIQTLENKGSPEAFLVNIRHVGGEQGLLALLAKAGYTNVKRVYAVK